jgi:hypothetical protein
MEPTYIQSAPIAKITTSKTGNTVEPTASSMEDSRKRTISKDRTNPNIPGRTTSHIINDMETAMGIVNFKK